MTGSNPAVRRFLNPIRLYYGMTPTLGDRRRTNGMVIPSFLRPHQAHGSRATCITTRKVIDDASFL